MSLSLVSGKSAFLHDGYIYIATIENCCVLIAVKHTLFPTRVASLLLGALFNTDIYYTCNVIVIMRLIQHKVVATEVCT